MPLGNHEVLGAKDSIFHQLTIDIEQSELFVWQQLEEEFLELLEQTASE